MHFSGDVFLSRALLAIGPLLAGVMLSGGSARAAVVLIPDIVDEDPIEALRTRADLLKVVGSIPGVSIAPLSRFKKLARDAHLDPLDLGSAKAAIGLGSSTKLTDILGGSVEEVYGRRVLRLRAFDRAGNLIYRSNLDLGEGTLSLEARQLVADRLMTAFGLSETIRSPSRVVVAHRDETPVATATLEEGDTQPRPASAAPAPQSAATVSTVEELPAPPGSDRAERFEDPGFQIELGVQGSLLGTSLVDDAQNGNCASGGSGCIGSLASSLYPGIIGRLETFPFHGRSDALAGLGLVATGSFASIKLEGSAPGQVGSAGDLRISGDLVYRLRLGFLSGSAAIFSPSLGLRAGLETTRFDPGSDPMGGVQVSALDRFDARFGVEILEPLGSHARIVLGAELPVSPTPGNAAQLAVQSQSATSDGFGLSCEIQGHFASPNASGLTASLRIAYQQFDDCFETVAGAGCAFSGSQEMIDFDAMIGWAFY